MNNSALEDKLESITVRLLAATEMTSNISYEPKQSFIVQYKKTQQTKIMVIVACIFVTLSTTVIAVTGNFIFVPGIGSLSINDNRITHSIISTVKMEKDGYTHQIISAYVENGYINLELFYYNTATGIKFDNQYNIDIINNSFNSPVDYLIYYDGKKCDNYTKSYGTSISLSYKLPRVKKDDVMTVSLYSGGTYLDDISLIPTKQLEKLTNNISFAKVNDTILTADITREDDDVLVYISAILPNDAYKGSAGEIVFVKNHILGFAESDIVIQDENGLEYKRRGSDSAKYNEEAMIARSWHFHLFEIPNNAKLVKIIIPSITYRSKDGNEITIAGPWEILVK